MHFPSYSEKLSHDSDDIFLYALPKDRSVFLEHASANKHISAACYVLGTLIIHREATKMTVLCIRAMAIRKKTRSDSSVSGLFTTFVQRTKLLSPKSALDHVHVQLGVSHSW